MKNSIFILLLLVSTFCYSQEKSLESPMIAIKIPLGETISIENHSVTFKEVLEDSRCPVDVNCVWAGRAKINIEISNEKEGVLEKNIIFGEVMQGESNDKVLFTGLDSRKVLALKLNPYPESNDQSEERAYVLLVYVEK